MKRLPKLRYGLIADAPAFAELRNVDVAEEQMSSPPPNAGRRIILRGALGGSVFLLPKHLLAASDVVGLVRQVQGTAFVKRDEGQRPLSAGDDVRANDVASTGDQPSRLQLDFRPGTRIRLGANAIFAVDPFIKGLRRSVVLYEGAALIEHGPHGGPNVTLRSPYALLAARGTVFFAGPSNGVFGVFVRDGVVDVKTALGRVTLNAGEGTDIAVPGVAPTPPARWGRVRIEAALASVL